MNCNSAQHALQCDLDGELTPLRKRALRRHLAACETCRIAVQQHASIRSAMTRLAAASAAAPGGGRLARLSKQKGPTSASSTHHPSMHWQRYAAVAAVVALCITGWRIVAQLRHNRRPEIAATQPQPEPPTTPSVPTAPRPVVRVDFDPSADVIAIPKPSHNPNITVLWIYPAIRTAEAKSAPAIEPNPTDSQGAHS